MAPTLVVLAAGMGSRYGGLKQIEPVGPAGEFIIDYSVFDAARAGFGRVVFVIRRELEEAFREAVGDRYAALIPVEYAYQELDDLPPGRTLPAERRKPWGTGHAVLAARGRLREPFAVINADDFYGREGYALLADHLARPAADMECCMAGFTLRNTLSPHGAVSRGICTTDGQGFLQEVVEAKAVTSEGEGAVYPDDRGAPVHLTGDEPVSMNMWGFPPAFLPFMEEEFARFLERSGDDPGAEFFLPLPVSRMIESGRGRCRVLPTGATWFGVTYPEDKPAVERALRRLAASGEYPEKLF